MFILVRDSISLRVNDSAALLDKKIQLYNFILFWYFSAFSFRERLNVSTELGGLPSRNRKLVTYIQKLKHFTLYAFQVEAVVLKNEGAKSDLVFIQTKENGRS